MSPTRLSRKQRREQRKSGDHIFDNKFAMKKISPLTATQDEMFSSYSKGQNIAAIGSAGSGKTYIAMYLALKDVLETEQYDKVIIIRSAVQTRDQGFMPGDLKQKEAYFESPYVDIAGDLFERNDAYAILKQKSQIEFTTSSFIRGLTFDNSIIIVDEAQSMSFHELDTIITRVGNNARIIFCGDTKQNDLIKSKYDVSGLAEFISILKRLQSFSFISFTTDDIVRSPLVKEYIIAKELIQL